VIKHTNGQCTERFGEPPDQGWHVEGRFEDTGDTDVHAMVRAKGTRISEPEETGHLCVIAHLRVSIEGQVYRVETTSALNKRLHPPKVRPDQSLWLTPKQPVMDNEKLRLLRHGPFKRGQTGIDSKRHSGDLIGPFDLQAILRLVLDLFNTEVVIKVIDQFVSFH
jgi:hypothetical protein